jgi:U3 small nucleolar RNA-associated protein 15
VWDTRKNDEPVVALCNNIKTVNSIFISEEDNRLFTGSVDCHLKIYEMDQVSSAHQFKIVNQIKYPKPISCFTFSPDMAHLGIGLVDGTVTMTKNKEREKKVEVLDESAFLLNVATNKQALDYKYFFRGIYDKRPKYNTDDTIDMKKSVKLSKYDTFLK